MEDAEIDQNQEMAGRFSGWAVDGSGLKRLALALGVPMLIGGAVGWALGAAIYQATYDSRDIGILANFLPFVLAHGIGGAVAITIYFKLLGRCVRRFDASLATRDLRAARVTPIIIVVVVCLAWLRPLVPPFSLLAVGTYMGTPATTIECFLITLLVVAHSQKYLQNRHLYAVVAVVALFSVSTSLYGEREFAEETDYSTILHHWRGTLVLFNGNSITPPDGWTATLEHRPDIDEDYESIKIDLQRSSAANVPQNVEMRLEQDSDWQLTCQGADHCHQVAMTSNGPLMFDDVDTWVLKTPRGRVEFQSDSDPDGQPKASTDDIVLLADALKPVDAKTMRADTANLPTLED
jgi:hypothetical protein